MRNKIKVDKDSGCWLWTASGSGGSNGTAYGVVRINKKLYYVHRWVYETFIGPIPDGYQVSHSLGCLSTRCVNPDHLEALSIPDHFHKDRQKHIENGQRLGLSSRKAENAHLPKNIIRYRADASKFAAQIHVPRDVRKFNNNKRTLLGPGRVSLDDALADRDGFYEKLREWRLRL